MKIYASRDPFDLDRFIGKDLWVKCIDTSDEFSAINYVRVLAKSPRGYYVNHVHDFTVADFAGCNKQVLISTLAGTSLVPFNVYKICPEQEVYTTAELMSGAFEFDEDIYDIDEDLISELVGKDIWIMAQNVSHADIYDGRYYIKIHSFNNNVITYSRVGASNVDEYPRFYLMNDKEIRDAVLHVWTSHIGDWTLYPEYRYTTEEISRKIEVEL